MSTINILDSLRIQKHGTTSKQAKPVKLNAQEQAKIAKLGLEMKLLTSEMDAEMDKWQQPDNEVYINEITNTFNNFL